MALPSKYAYGELGKHVNDNLSAEMVKTTTGMQIQDYAQQTVTTDHTFPNTPDPVIQEMQRKIQTMEMEQRIAEAQMRVELNTPFDETDDFRDYVVWLCGYTQRKTPPSQEEWEDLRNETKKVAAKFALRTRTKRALAHGGSEVSSNGIRTSIISGTTSALAGQGVSGSQTLVGNEVSISSCYAKP
jgi:hypothetical protein